MDQLIFNAADHTYWLGGKPIPNVTRILAPLVDYSMVRPEVLELARQKGQAVHAMADLWAKNDLAEDKLPEWMKPVLAEWLKFVDDTGLKVVASEKKVYHPIYGYAGAFDARATMRGMLGHGMLDLKRSFMAGKVTGLQTAAYAEAENAEGYTRDTRVRWRAALKLREDGPYRLEIFDDANDFSVFLAALKHYTTGQTLDEWKRKNK